MGQDYFKFFIFKESVVEFVIIVSFEICSHCINKCSIKLLKQLSDGGCCIYLNNGWFKSPIYE